jgi:hypothetical protein
VVGEPGLELTALSQIHSLDPQHHDVLYHDDEMEQVYLIHDMQELVFHDSLHDELEPVYLIHDRQELVLHDSLHDVEVQVYHASHESLLQVLHHDEVVHHGEQEHDVLHDELEQV